MNDRDIMVKLMTEVKKTATNDYKSGYTDGVLDYFNQRTRGEEYANSESEGHKSGEQVQGEV